MDGFCNVAHVMRTLHNRDPIRICCAMTGQLTSKVNKQVL